MREIDDALFALLNSNDGRILEHMPLIAKTLIDAGADVNAKYKDDTPLMLAAQHGDKPAAELAAVLIALGADVNAKNERGRSILDMVMPWATQTLDWNPRDIRIWKRDYLMLILEAGADVDVDSPLTKALLQRAARVGDIGIVRILLNAGTDPDAKDDEGRTPTDWATEKGHDDIVAMLHEHIMHAETAEAGGQSDAKAAGPSL